MQPNLTLLNLLLDFHAKYFTAHALSPFLYKHIRWYVYLNKFFTQIRIFSRSTPLYNNQTIPIPLANLKIYEPFGSNHFYFSFLSKYLSNKLVLTKLVLKKLECRVKRFILPYFPLCISQTVCKDPNVDHETLGVERMIVPHNRQVRLILRFVGKSLLGLGATTRKAMSLSQYLSREKRIAELRSSASLRQIACRLLP